MRSRRGKLERQGVVEERERDAEEHMTIVKGFTSNEWRWRDSFIFFLNSLSIAEECLSVFRTEWS
ncbi:hypothetical protein YC2023_117287 [Brassica napus]